MHNIGYKSIQLKAIADILPSSKWHHQFCFICILSSQVLKECNKHYLHNFQVIHEYIRILPFFHKSENKELPLSLYIFNNRAKIRTILANLIQDLN